MDFLIEFNKKIPITVNTSVHNWETFISFTALPIINLYTQSDKIGDKYTYGSTIIIDPEYENYEGKAVIEDLMKIRRRGQATRKRPQKSYKIKFEYIEESVLGMKPDNEWLLIQTWTDHSKVRQKFCSDLWNMINSTNREQTRTVDINR